MMDENKVKRRAWAAGILLIACLLLAPGIRGYSDWQWHEYVIGVAMPIGLILYPLITGRKFAQG